MTPKSKPLERKRSSKWPKFRKAFLKGKVCAVCGSRKKVEAHHIWPFHLYPEKELKRENLIALCESQKSINCHLFFGHLGNYSGWNEMVRRDADLWHFNLIANKERIKRTKEAEREEY